MITDFTVVRNVFSKYIDEPWGPLIFTILSFDVDYIQFNSPILYVTYHIVNIIYDIDYGRFSENYRKFWKFFEQKISIWDFLVCLSYFKSGLLQGILGDYGPIQDPKFFDLNFVRLVLLDWLEKTPFSDLSPPI